MNRSRTAWRLSRGASLVLGVVLLVGCTTTQNRDPLEPFNRKVFGFNEALDTALIKPVATGYAAVTPTPVQTGITNFVNNFKDVWSAINLLLQGRPGEAAQEVLRVGVNTAFGMAGFIDVATSMQLDRHNEDLGQTLGVWGVPDGAYLVLPFFGPSNVRDAIALPADQYFSPSNALNEPRDANGMRLLQIINARAQVLGATELLADVALDKYAFVRDAYMQRRRNMIYNGEPPEEQSLWDADVAPMAVVKPSAAWAHLAQGPLNGALAPSDAVQTTLAWRPMVVNRTVAQGAPADVLASTGRVTPEREEPVNHLAYPSAEELAGLRADGDLR